MVMLEIWSFILRKLVKIRVAAIKIANRRVEDGTHNLLGGRIQRKNAKKRVEDGTHHFLGGEIVRKNAKKRVQDGTHNFLGGENNKKRVEDGTHNFLNQIKKTCPHCGIICSSGMFGRWHGDKCKQNSNKI